MTACVPPDLLLHEAFFHNCYLAWVDQPIPGKLITFMFIQHPLIDLPGKILCRFRNSLQCKKNVAAG